MMYTLLKCLVFSVVATSVSAQYRNVYCNNTLLLNGDTDLLVTTRRYGASYYEANMDCEFIISYFIMGGRFMVTLMNYDLGKTGSPIVYVKDSKNGNDLISPITSDTSNGDLSRNQQFASKGNSVYIRFKTGASLSLNSGVQFRVTFFHSLACPVGWLKVGSTCYGTLAGASNFGSKFNFRDSQIVCNGMRANLLISDSYTVSSTQKQVRDYGLMSKGHAWIGITDLRYNQYSYYWLDNTYFYNINNVRCYSRYLSNTGCYTSERCGAFDNAYSPSRPIMMDNCYSDRYILCSMPVGGTDRFYPVPAVLNANPTVGLIVGLVFAGLFIVAFIIGVIYFCNRSPRFISNRNLGGTAVVVGSPSVVVPPPSTSYTPGYGQPAPYPVQTGYPSNQPNYYPSSNQPNYYASTNTAQPPPYSDLSAGQGQQKY